MKIRKKAKHYCLPLLFSVIVLGCIGVKTFLPNCVRMYYSFVDTQNARPEYGSYFCEELNAKIVFGEEISYFYSDGTSERLLLPLGNSADLDGESGQFYAMYYWDQETDLVKIAFSQYPEDFEKSKDYIFRKEK